MSIKLPVDPLGISLSPSRQLPIEEILSLALRAESLAYDSIWVPETWGIDAGSVLTLLAARTTTLRLASGIFNVYSRSAALIAMTAATLQGLSRGRLILGLGASGPIVIENWHALPYHRPLARTRDYVEIIRQALSGKRVDYEGVALRARNFKLLNPPEAPVPIFIAALGPRNLRLTGEIADGCLPIFPPLGQVPTLLAEIRVGERAAGRAPSSVTVAAYLPALVGPRSELLLRQQLAYYIGGMGDFYAAFVARLGFESETRQIRQLWQAEDRRQAVMAISDALLDACTLPPRGATARARLAAYRSQGIGLPILALPRNATADEVAETLETLAPARH